MKQKAVSNIYIMQNHSSFAFWGRQGVGRWEDTFKEEGWIGLNSIVWMWYGFQKTKLSFLSGVICRGSNSLVVMCVTLNLAHPPCFVLQSGSGYLVVVFVYVTEFVGMKSRTWASIHLHSFFAFVRKWNLWEVRWLPRSPTERVLWLQVHYPASWHSRRCSQPCLPAAPQGEMQGESGQIIWTWPFEQLDGI